MPVRSEYNLFGGGQNRLRQRFKTLTPADIAASKGGGFVGSFDMLGADPGLAAWLRFRKDSLTQVVCSGQACVSCNAALLTASVVLTVQYFAAISDGVKSGIGREVVRFNRVHCRGNMEAQP